MKLLSFAGCAVFALCASAQAPLPELKIEAIDAGSAFVVRNVAQQPLTAYLIELVDYPGSFYAYYEDPYAAVILNPGGEKRVPITNMTVGAAPEYVKMQAAVYQDGSTAGAPAKVEQILARRRHLLVTTRTIIERLEIPGTSKQAGIDALKKWSATIPAPTRATRATQAAANNAAAATLLDSTASILERYTLPATLTELKRVEASLAASKP